MGTNGGVRPGAGRPRGKVKTLIGHNRTLIEESGVVEFLLEVFEGKEIDGEKIDLKMRVDVAQFLAKKIIPDVKAVEVTGPGGGNIIVEAVQYVLEDVTDDS